MCEYGINGSRKQMLHKLLEFVKLQLPSDT